MPNSDEVCIAQASPAWRLRLGDFAIALGCFILMVGQLLLFSHHKHLWIDEIFTFYQIDDKSFSEIYESLRGGMNLMPPLYFWVLKAVIPIFPGDIELAMRLPSAIATGLSVALCYMLLTPVYGRLAALFSVLLLSVGSTLIMLHNLDARPYAPLFLCAIGLVYILCRMTNQKTACTWQTSGLLVMFSWALGSLHYFGIGYAGLTGIAFIVSNGQYWRPRARASTRACFQTSRNRSIN